ncbi:hypothetical protein [Mycetocola zhadangensis]|uniref:hypothetical protein n=1 Tax=Mycetocola zhadangensis TaxID=1164595 RepID=UPI000EF5A636|nr:hypothetical protein [Mycetocola zhadangensis]
MAEWVPLAVAVVAGVSTVGVQLFIARGEPSAIKRIKLLSEAIDSMPDNDQGRVKLVDARTHLASRLAKSLIGVQGFARLLRLVAWGCLAIGTVTVGGWLLYLAFVPGAATIEGVSNFGTAGVAFIVFSPVFLIYSALWPKFDSATDLMIGWVARTIKRQTPTPQVD